jgi:hypothetical protein
MKKESDPMTQRYRPGSLSVCVHLTVDDFLRCSLVLVSCRTGPMDDQIKTLTRNRRLYSGSADRQCNDSVMTDTAASLS